MTTIPTPYDVSQLWPNSQQGFPSDRSKIQLEIKISVLPLSAWAFLSSVSSLPTKSSAPADLTTMSVRSRNLSSIGLNLDSKGSQVTLRKSVNDYRSSLIN